MKTRIKLLGLALFTAILSAVLIFAAFPQQNQQAQAVSYNTHQGKSAKYVFFFIGDGMGMSQITSTEIFKGAVNGKSRPATESLSFTRFSKQGIQTTYATDTFITDSAAAGTALASGYKTASGVINMDPSLKTKFKTMAEMAKDKGMKVGIVSSVSIDHATPAAFYSHQTSRKNAYEIGVELVNSNFDYFGGGGFLAPKGKNNDKTDILELAKQKGYKVVNTTAAIQSVKPEDGKVLAINPFLDGEQALTYDINRSADDLSLADYTKKGIELLDNPKGFFMMVEGGKIDWACHANDAASTIKDMMAFNDSIEEALKFYKQHPDETLIVVTGDHETGGMSIGFAGTQYDTFFNKIAYQTMSYDVFDAKIKEYKKAVGVDGARLADWIPAIEQNFGLLQVSKEEQKDLKDKAKAGDKAAAERIGRILTDLEISKLQEALAASMLDPKARGAYTDPQTYLLYGGYEPFSITLTHILNQKAGIGWTTYAHTGVAIPVYAQGTGATLFNGYYDNTDIAKKLMSIMGVSQQ